MKINEVWNIRVGFHLRTHIYILKVIFISKITSQPGEKRKGSNLLVKKLELQNYDCETQERYDTGHTYCINVDVEVVVAMVECLQ